MKILYFCTILMLIIITIGTSLKLSQASPDSGSLTELYTPSPDLTNMSLSLSNTFEQTSPNSTKDLHLEFFNAKNSTMIKNVSFFINATKDGKVLMNDLFYTKTGSMTIKFSPGSDTKKWTVTGSHDPILGGWMSKNDTLPITTSAFTEKGTYHIHFAVLALVYVNGMVDPSNPPTFDSWWAVDEKGNISNYNSTVSFGSSTPSFKIKNESPLKQFKSGIAAKDVTCNDDFSLVMKTEDGTPACVKPTSISKLLIRGWAMSSLKDFGHNPGRGPGTFVNTQENACGQFFTAPGNQNYSNTVPVLMMGSNSTACAKMTFTVTSNYKNCNGHNCQHLVDLYSILHINNLYYEKHDGSFSITQGKDYTNSFKITAMPDTIDLANYPVGTNFTVTYVIKSLPNATGFYDQSIPKLACERYPLAVGYAASQVNASDFSYIDPLNAPCVAGTDVLTGVEISGMDYKKVTLRLAILGQ